MNVRVYAIGRTLGRQQVVSRLLPQMQPESVGGGEAPWTVDTHRNTSFLATKSIDKGLIEPSKYEWISVGSDGGE